MQFKPTDATKAACFHPNRAIVELAADSRQVSSRYSELCAAIPNAEDGVRSANPNGFTFKEQQLGVTQSLS